MPTVINLSQLCTSKPINLCTVISHIISQNILSKIEALYFVWFIIQFGPTKGLSVFLSLPWPSESNRDDCECKFHSLKFHDFCQKIYGREGGQHEQHCVKNKFVKNSVGGRGVKLNLNNVFKYTFFFRLPLSWEYKS